MLYGANPGDQDGAGVSMAPVSEPEGKDTLSLEQKSQGDARMTTKRDSAR